MPISPQGQINLAALSVPNVYVQLQPPAALINGVQTDILGVVGTAVWGPVNTPVEGSFQDILQKICTPQVVKYDLATAVFVAAQAGANNFRCVRVTDGTDTASQVALLDMSSTPVLGAYLTGRYTGTLGNTLYAVIALGSSYTPSSPSYKISVYMTGGIPEVYDNISGDNNTFWQNLVDAINNGQSISRGPSQLVIASLGTGIGSVSVTDPGTGYTSLPTVSASVGSGATFSTTLKGLSVTVAAGGTGYVVGDPITLAGGTATTPIVLTVSTVSGGVITGVSLTTAGVYTVIPSNPIAQDSTLGAGTGATFNLVWGVNTISVLTAGTGYNISTVISITGGSGSGAAATANLGAQSGPNQTTYNLTGGTSGNTPGVGNVTTETLIGTDGSSRTGMYALRKAVTAGAFMLADADDSTFWTNQNEFAQSEATYGIGTMPPGYQDNSSGAATLVQTSGVNSYSFVVHLGDWIQINDTFNNVTRYVSPQAFRAGELVALVPSESTLNKPLNGIVATQKTAEGGIYSDSELSFLRTSRIDVITNPIPFGDSYGVRFGINTSSNPLQQTDNYTRMVNFIGATLLKAMGPYVGRAMSPTVLSQVSAVANSFLQNLVGLEYISNFKVILDASNNPPDRTALGYLQVNCLVYIFPIIQYLIVNLDVEQNSTISVQTPQVATAQLLTSAFGG